MNPKLRILVSVVVGAALAALIAFAQTPTQQATQQSTNGAIGNPFGGSFAGMTDQEGKTVTADTFTGKYELVFFGFTYCPAICPTELQKVASVMRKLDSDEQAKITPIFVSLDPERDTPKVLKAYTAMFHPAITGLTGTPEVLKRIKSDWKVYSAKVQTPEMKEYTIDHSAFMYLRAPDGTLQGLFQTTDTPETVYETVKKALTAAP